jgi:hypothetical protein
VNLDGYFLPLFSHLTLSRCELCLFSFFPYYSLTFSPPFPPLSRKITLKPSIIVIIIIIIIIFFRERERDSTREREEGREGAKNGGSSKKRRFLGLMVKVL